MGRDLNGLATYVRPLCIQFLGLATKAGVPCLLVDTDRTPEEQVVKLQQGVSWTQHSKHEPQPPEGRSEAFDVCPLMLSHTKYWSPDSPLWAKLGQIGESLGLEWGGRWTHLNGGRGDPGHFQYVHKAEVKTT